MAAQARRGESDAGCLSAGGPRSGAPRDVHQLGNRHCGARRHRSRDGPVERERVPAHDAPSGRARRDELLAVSNSWRVGFDEHRRRPAITPPPHPAVPGVLASTPASTRPAPATGFPIRPHARPVQPRRRSMRSTKTLSTPQQARNTLALRTPFSEQCGLVCDKPGTSAGTPCCDLTSATGTHRRVGTAVMRCRAGLIRGSRRSGLDHAVGCAPVAVHRISKTSINEFNA